MDRLYPSLLSLALAFLVGGCASMPLQAPPPRLISSSPPVFQAQPPEPLPDSPTLDQVVEVALYNHPEVASLLSEQTARQSMEEQAGLLANPHLSAELENIMGNGSFSGFEAAELTVGVSQEFPLGGKRHHRILAAQNDTRLVDWDLRERSHSLMAEIRTAYADIVAAQRLLALRKQSETLVQRLVDAVKQRVDSGDVSPVEGTRVNVELSTARIDRRRADRQLATARVHLSSLLGKTEPTFAAVQGYPPMPAVLPSLEIMTTHLSQHPAILRWDAEFERLKTQENLARAEAWSDLEVGAGYRRERDSNDHAFLVEVGFDLPVFNRNRAEIAAARAQLARAETDREAAWRRLSGELRLAVADLHAQQSIIADLKNLLLPQVEETFKVAKTSYAAGQGDLLDLLDAERSVLETRSALVEATTEQLTIQARLEALLGTSLNALASQSSEKE